jgi:hypothetical protein
MIIMDATRDVEQGANRSDGDNISATQYVVAQPLTLPDKETKDGARNDQEDMGRRILEWSRLNLFYAESVLYKRGLQGFRGIPSLSTPEEWKALQGELDHFCKSVDRPCHAKWELTNI